MALEAYSINSEKTTTDQELFDVLVTTISKHCKIRNPTDDDITYFMDRLKEIKEEIAGNAKQLMPQGKTFGSAYMDYVSELPIDGALLKMVNYDIDAAEKLYCTIDREDVVSLVKEYIKGKAEENLVNMEAAMYGFGGSYADDKKESKGMDISSEQGAAALKSLGF